MPVWGDDGTIVFGTLTGLAIVSALGGDVRQLTTAENEPEGTYHRWPQVLPGVEAVLFTKNQGRDDSSIEVVSIGSGERRTVVEEGTDGRYVATGHLLFLSSGRIHAVPFDVGRLTTTGPAVPVLDDVAVRGAGVGVYDLSSDGTLAYQPLTTDAMREVLWVSRDGQAEPALEPDSFQGWARLAPDGNQIVTCIEGSVWIHDVSRGTKNRLTFEEPGSRPVWSPDGRWIAFRSSGAGRSEIYRKRADGRGGAEQLTYLDYAGVPIPQSFSADGSVLAFTNLYSGSNVGFLNVGEESDRKGDVSDVPDSEQTSPMFSPRDSLVAYVSMESGRSEVYVAEYPDSGAKWQVSTNGGQEPVWSRDGTELFFRNGYKMMAVTVEPGPSFGQPRLLFEEPYELPGNRVGPMYDVAADGRFLMLRRVGEDRDDEIRIVLNFDQELETLAPTSD